MATAKRTRIKAKSLPTPQTREEAEALLLRIGALQNAAARIEADMNDALATLKAQYEAEAAPINQEMQEKFQALHAWAEANRETLLKGDAKTAKLATGEIAWRTTPPKVSVRGVKQVIETLKKLGLKQFIRIKEEINKEAILADAESRQLAGEISGITITQQEEFIAKPFETELEVVEPCKKAAA